MAHENDPAPRPAALHEWLTGPTDSDVRRSIERLRRSDDVVRVAVMPDVHLANDVCVGLALATRRLVYPSAVGGDIGCGMLAMAFGAGAELLEDPARAGALLRALAEAVPTHRRHRRRAVPFPAGLRAEDLSHPALAAAARDDGMLQLGTLGGGNHFLELQVDAADGRLWLMIHTGSRAMGQAIRGHHLARAVPAAGGLKALDTATDAGRAYLSDVAWARRYADANRSAIAAAAAGVLSDRFGVVADEATLLACDHNHVAAEAHDGEALLVHRKGAMPADAGAAGVLPGSMGTLSYHVEGRGCAASLRSSAHGAGRELSREAARRRFSERDLLRQMAGVWFDPRLARGLRDEAPGAYKDVRKVLRAQEDLVRVTRTLRPLLAVKAT